MADFDFSDISPSRQGSRAYDIAPRNTKSGMHARIIWTGGLPKNPNRASDIWVDTFLAATGEDLERRLGKIVADAKANLPVSWRRNKRGEAYGIETGTLQENITYEHVDEVTEGVMFSIEVEEATRPNDGVSTQQYWEAQEFGWTMKTGEFMPGTHAIGNALQKHSQDAYWAARTGIRAANKAIMRAAGTSAVQSLFNDVGESISIQTEQD